MKFTKGHGKNHVARKNPAMYGTPEQRAMCALQQLSDHNEKVDAKMEEKNNENSIL